MRRAWDPQRERRELLAEVNRVFRAARQRAEAVGPQQVTPPPLDFVTTESAYLVAVDLPGVAREAIEVQVERGALSIRGRKPPSGGSDQVLRRERQYGAFARLIPLPDDADLGDVTATLEAGELVVRIGRRAETGPRRVEVVEM
jgi:HSP20 family protein